jgi:hypothetical protein
VFLPPEPLRSSQKRSHQDLRLHVIHGSEHVECQLEHSPRQRPAYRATSGLLMSLVNHPSAPFSPGSIGLHFFLPQSFWLTDSALSHCRRSSLNCQTQPASTELSVSLSTICLLAYKADAAYTQNHSYTSAKALGPQLAPGPAAVQFLLSTS